MLGVSRRNCGGCGRSWRRKKKPSPEPHPAARLAATEVLDRIPRHRYALQTIRAFLDLVLSAPCSGRAAAWVLRWCGGRTFGAAETPCANAGRTWLFRLGLAELTCPQEQADDWVWLVDHTVQLGSHKRMIVVGLRLGAWQAEPRPLAQAAEHYVRHRGLHADAVAELAPRLQALAVCPRSWRMKNAIVEFLSGQAAAARPGERLIGSTEVLESIIGKYKRLQSAHSGGGMTA